MLAPQGASAFGFVVEFFEWRLCFTGSVMTRIARSCTTDMPAVSLPELHQCSDTTLWTPNIYSIASRQQQHQLATHHSICVL